MTTPTTPTSFLSKLEARVSAVGSLLCVGLDPHEDDLFPGSSSGGARTDEARCDAAFTFCKTLIDLTLPYTACYKPNAAFFEALGDGGLEVLQRICRHIHDATTRSRMANANANTTTKQDDDAFVPAVQVPTVPILLDVKRGDIGTTAHAYAVACYDYIGADAVTLSPLMGYDSIRPFVSGKYSHKAAFLLCKTSNPGSQELMACKLSASSSSSSSDETLYERIAMLTGTEWAKQCADESSSTGGTGSCSGSGSGAMLGLVVGATDPMAMAQVRQAAGPNVWILAPGVGAQGGDLIEACRAGLNAQGTGMLIPVSRGISRAQDPAQVAQDLQLQIQKVVQEVFQEASTTTKHDTGDQQQQIATNSCNEVIQPHQREFLEYSLSQSVLKFGSFVLKSGRTSPYFFNAGLFATGAALFRVGKAYASTIMESSPTL
jgi:orotidine 5'-phosphate decarboxylase subfamily 2